MTERAPEVKDDETWRIAQVFLSSNPAAMGVFEVYISGDGEFVRCTCPGYASRTTCKHVDHVESVLEENDGEYVVTLDSGLDVSALNTDDISDEDWRDIVVKYGSVEVLA